MKLFIFGSTGDLIKRKVLLDLQKLKQDLEIYALGRKNFTSEIYEDFVCQGRCSPEFKKKIHYKKIDFEKEDLCNPCSTLFDKSKVNFIYIAMPPKFLLKIIKELSKINKKFKLRILIEKPFGENLESALELQKIIKEKDIEEDIFLSDHYLFKKEVERLNFNNFNKIKFLSLEKLGVEERINYYDDIGALKDMVQSHFFNLIFKFVKTQDLAGAKIKKLIRGQYKNYKKELKEDSETETAIYLEFKDGGKEFVFFTGKKFSQKESLIEVDGKRIELKTGGEYKRIFNEFLNEKCENFPTIEDSIASWKIIKKIEDIKSPLKIYRDNITEQEFKNEAIEINKEEKK